MIITLDTTIRDLFDNELISVRTYNGLRYEGYISIKDIQEKHTDLTDLLKIRNFGKKSLYELTEVLKLVHNIKQENIDDLDFSKKFYIKFGDLEKLTTIENIICESFEANLNIELSSLSLIKETHLSGISLFYNLFSDYQYFFRVYPSLTYNENVEIRTILYSFLKSILDSLAQLDDSCKSNIKQVYKSGLYNPNKIEDYNKFKKHLFSPLLELYNYIKDKVEYVSYIDKFTYFFKPLQKEFFENEYRLALSKASVRTSNVANRYLSNIITVVGLLEDPIHSLSNNKNLPAIISCNKSRTNIELTQILLHLKDKFDEIFQLEESSIRMFSIKKDYPFLINSQRAFIQEFEQEFGYKPYFYILFNYLRVASNDDRDIRILCKFFGVSFPLQSLTDIANQENITTERVKQIVTKGIIKVPNIVKIDISKYEQIIDKQFFLCDDPDYLELIKRERLSCSFNAFGELLKIFAPFEVISFDSLEIIKSTNIFERKSLSKIIGHITKYNRERKAEDKVVPFTHFYPKINDSEKALLAVIINFLAIPNVCIYEDNLIFKQTYIDTKLEIIKILEEKGEPMFLNEIFEKFKRKYPGHKYNSANQLRASMKPPIKAIGKQSRYGIETWDNIFWGSIRDLLINCLVNSVLPLHIDELLKEVLVHYPSTNIKNIASTMSSDESDRFIQFEGGYYGLVEREYPKKFVKSPIIHRYKFEERLQMFKDFVNTYQRFPLSNGGEFEASLHRWYYNISNDVLEITEEQLIQFNNMVSYYESKYIPRSGYEIEFLNNCNDYKAFIKMFYILPDRNNGEELYYWLIRSKENYNSYTDFRRIYFSDLLTFISSYGFKI